jgi:hypothetical protein
MDWMLDIDLKKLARPIAYRDKILLMGSCFTEHIGDALEELKFSVLQNQTGYCLTRLVSVKVWHLIFKIKNTQRPTCSN